MTTDELRVMFWSAVCEEMRVNPKLTTDGVEKALNIV